MEINSEISNYRRVGFTLDESSKKLKLQSQTGVITIQLTEKRPSNCAQLLKTKCTSQFNLRQEKIYVRLTLYSSVFDKL